jgi:hypothetical protein
VVPNLQVVLKLACRRSKTFLANPGREKLRSLSLVIAEIQEKYVKRQAFPRLVLSQLIHSSDR